MEYRQLIFSELRLAAITFGNGVPDDNALLKAVTVNEELINIGYTLSPEDTVRLAVSPDIDGFVRRIREYAGDVKAEPMYPDFPDQVMKMNEAQFRFHQMIHYLSTYGVEDIFGVKVSKGWLPETENKSEKTEADNKLLDAKVIELIDNKNRYIIPFKKILSRTERMDDKQRLIIRECTQKLPAKEIISVNVAFKQNLLDLFNAVFTAENISNENKLKYLQAMCQHTGDVLKCTDYALTRAKFHFRTSQKRLLVKLIESYPAQDLEENLILSNKKSERAELMLRYMDYNIYSRSKEHKAAVRQLRNGELRSWESKAKSLVGFSDPKALEFYSTRPGMMLRSLTYLLRNGYKADDVYNAIAPKATALKTQTLVSLMSFFSRPQLSELDDKKYQESLIINIMINSLLKLRLAANKTPLMFKKVFIDCKGYDIDQSSIRINDRSNEGGYIRSGLAYKIPDEVKKLRFFIYWNDEKERVDVDLHACARLTDGSYSQIGWNADFKDKTMVFSGDITHSDAAEYIDIDLEKGDGIIDTVGVNINLFSGCPTFKEIDECFVGAMTVSHTGEEVKLYDPKNCFFSHYLTGKYRLINYGYVDVKNRVIVFDGVEGANGYYNVYMRNNGFSLDNYLDILLASQKAMKVMTAKEADVILVMGKPEDKKQLSLIDNNFFME